MGNCACFVFIGSLFEDKKHTCERKVGMDKRNVTLIGTGRSYMDIEEKNKEGWL